MTETTRKGGWPGPARPDWQFRPIPTVQAYVEAYATRLGISRSAAINAIINEHIHEEPQVREQSERHQ